MAGVGNDGEDGAANWTAVLDAINDHDEEHANLTRKTEKQVKTEHGVITAKIPSNYYEAIRHPNEGKWQKAMEEEIKSHEKAKTWELVNAKDVPQSKKICGSTWSYDIKRGEDGSITRYKARFCAQGFSQEAGTDYVHTYSNTIAMNTLRIMFALSAQNDLELTSVDVRTAYLYGDLDEEIYMRQPKGFEKHSETGETMVCHLLHSIYGLKQSGACWETRLSKFLTEKLHFARCDQDPSFYRKSDPLILLAVYVDDLIIATPSGQQRQDIISEVSAEFEIKDNGKLTWVLGTNIKQDLMAGSVSMNNTLYIEDCVRELLGECYLTDKSPKTPVVPCNETILELEEPNPDNKIDPKYRSALGKLGWVTQTSRPDVAYAYSVLSRYASCGGEAHMAHLLHVFKYLARTKGYALRWAKENTELTAHIHAHSAFDTRIYPDHHYLTAWTDASHGGEKPMTGYVIFLNGGPIAFRSGKQKVTGISSCENEYIAATLVASETIATRDLLNFAGSTQDFPTYCCILRQQSRRYALR